MSASSSFGYTRLARIAALVAVTTATLITVSSCKKKAPPTPPPASAAGAASGPIPTIATTGGAFDPDSWVQRKLVTDKDVSVGAGNSHASVTYAAIVKTIDQSAVDSSFEGMSSDGHGAVFKGASAEIRALKAGDVFLVKNQFAVKILAAQTTGDETVLIFDKAKLSEVIASGKINIDSPITFHGPATAALQPPARSFRIADLFETPVYAQNGTGTPLSESRSEITPGYNTPKPGLETATKASDQAKDFLKTLTSGWTIEKWTVTPGNNNAVISSSMHKDSGGFLAAIGMQGTISNFNFAQNLSFPFDSTQISQGVKGLSGTMHFTWEIGKNTPGVWAIEDKVKLPAGVTIPLGPVLEGIPLTLDISAALLIHPALTGGNEYSKGGFTVGFKGSGSDEDLTFSIDSDQSISPIAPNAMVISFCIPRIELQLGLFSSYASNKTLKTAVGAIDKVVSKLMAQLPADMQAKLAASPMAGASVSNLLASNADVYLQFIHTEGVTHASNMTLAPCSKQQIKVSAQVGGDTTLFGKTASSSTTDLFSKEFLRWNPASDFCKSI